MKQRIEFEKKKLIHMSSTTSLVKQSIRKGVQPSERVSIWPSLMGHSLMNETRDTSEFDPSAKESNCTRCIDKDLPRVVVADEFDELVDERREELRQLLCALAYALPGGYCSGHSFMALMMIRARLTPHDAFCALVALHSSERFRFVDWHWPVRGDERAARMTARLNEFDVAMAKLLPRIHARFEQENVSPVLYSTWLSTAFASELHCPVDFKMRVWDAMLATSSRFVDAVVLSLFERNEHLLFAGTTAAEFVDIVMAMRSPAFFQIANYDEFFKRVHKKYYLKL
jgi:Rab-GTPase-TBC domain